MSVPDVRSAASRLGRFPATWIPGLYLLLLLCVSPLHSTFDEWGGVMQYFSGLEILQGHGYRGWAAHFWPPLYSLLIGLGSTILPAFTAGKLISIFSSSALLFVVYELTIRLGFPRPVGLLAQVTLGIHPVYVYESLQAHNHLLSPFLFALGATVFLTALDRPARGRFAVAGAVCGLAALTRYTSYVTGLLPLVLVTAFPRRRAVRFGSAFWTGFALVSLPWWYQNLRDNGNPLHSLNYLNVLLAVDPPAGPIDNLASLWHEYSRSGINGIRDVIALNPLEFARHLRHSIPRGLVLLSSGALGLATVPGLFAAAVTLTLPRLATVVGLLASLVLLVSPSLVVDRYLLSGVAIVTPLTVGFLWTFLGALQERYRKLAVARFRILVLSLLLTGGATLAVKAVLAYPTRHGDCCWLADAKEVGEALKRVDPLIAEKVVMAVDPARAYYAGSHYLAPPYGYDGDAFGMVSYEGVPDRMKRYAAKFPADMKELRADYLVYTAPNSGRWAPNEISAFSFLLDPDSPSVPKSFEPVYVAPSVVVYAIHWDDLE